MHMLRNALLSTAILSTVFSVWSQDQAPGSPAVKEKLGELKQSIAANQAKLHGYQWTQTTQVALKGETKKDSQFTCQYGPDGKVQKTLIGAPEPEKALPTRGLKGKIV